VGGPPLYGNDASNRVLKHEAAGGQQVQAIAYWTSAPQGSRLRAARPNRAPIMITTAHGATHPRTQRPGTRTTSRDIPGAFTLRESLRENRKPFRWPKGRPSRRARQRHRGVAQTRHHAALPHVRRSCGLGSVSLEALLEATRLSQRGERVESPRFAHPGQGRQSPAHFETRRDNEVRARESSPLNDCSVERLKRDRPRSCRCSATPPNPPAARRGTDKTSSRDAGLPAYRRPRGMVRLDRLRRP